MSQAVLRDVKRPHWSVVVVVRQRSRDIRKQTVDVRRTVISGLPRCGWAVCTMTHVQSRLSVSQSSLTSYPATV